MREKGSKCINSNESSCFVSLNRPCLIQVFIAGLTKINQLISYNSFTFQKINNSGFLENKSI